MLYVLNFADQNYRNQQQQNSLTASNIGKADRVLEFFEEDLQELREAYPEHFKIQRGYGLWFWKPFLILKAFSQIKDGDYLFYCDSGAVFIDDIHLLIPDLEKSGKDMMVFEQPLLSKCFTKAETFHLMGCTDYSGNQLLGGYILLKKSKESIYYMEEWLKAMSDIRVLSSATYCPNISEHKGFISHREDQSVLTILCKKWGIKGHRDPSDFGIFPWQYMRAGGYHRKKYPNSHYPVILLCVRKNNPESYRLSYEKALRRYKLGLNNELITRIKLFPMHCRHWGRLFARRIGMESILNKVLGRGGRR